MEDSRNDPGFDPAQVHSAEVVLSCVELDPTLRFFREVLGFRLEATFPADDPREALISGFGLRLRLERATADAVGTRDAERIRLHCLDVQAVAGGVRSLTAPNGTRIELVEANPPIELPPVRQSLVVTRMGDADQWASGRAGMRYRDLIPDRQGGRFIASHILVADGGPLPDYVHFHRIRFQLIYCYRGWVKVVYEDQGPAFVMREGDCVMQPPEIRHRVLECSAGLEVVEIACPAVHQTFADHQLSLPTDVENPQRDFGGQRFLRHQEDLASWSAWRRAGFEQRDLGVCAATDGLAGARVVRSAGTTESDLASHAAEFDFRFVLQGAATLHIAGREDQQLTSGDACVLPAGTEHALTAGSNDLEFLEVTLPGEPRSSGPGAA